MQLSDFHFDLPDQLIAQEPLPARSASRLLVQDGAELTHQSIADLPHILKPGDHLIFNNTKVIKARLFGQKLSGGKLELLIERVIGNTDVLTKIRSNKSLKPGAKFTVSDVPASIVGRERDLFHVRFELPSDLDLDSLLDVHGQLPLPPYINRTPDAQDATRYQTVFADTPGAVAAPTAGLHFDEALLQSLNTAGITHSFITLHVGAGTFMPVRSQDIQSHHMHAERVVVSDDTVSTIRAVKEKGGRVIAVGTTSVRSLEAAALSGTLKAFSGETDLFITPGKSFNVIDGMLTNFHLPESTLLMLVCAFGGYSNTMAAYNEAVLQEYRFFSYGDAMLVWPD
ncbi:MAG: tRNA preQ1(34) S-adenosylmethionine ribosyltransferase-isomerase QueA [Gammaproteobacteria bacterium]|nr:tRNA preQ1(34) S-adenosylmethionine ribosyltransferase-isomerase QueA [Gammaproteobacteria bacterium]